MNIYNFIFIFGIIAVIMIGSVLLYYLIFHFVIIFRGITQYEYMFNIDLKEEKYFESINNVSRYSKFTDIFGTNPLLWFLPLSKFNYFNFNRI